MSFRENILFTHRGLSGPAILQISSYWKPGESININLLPDFDLQEQLKAITKELGATEGEWVEVEVALQDTPLPSHVRDRAEREMERLKRLNPVAPEAAVIRTREASYPPPRMRHGVSESIPACRYGPPITLIWAFRLEMANLPGALTKKPVKNMACRFSGVFWIQKAATPKKFCAFLTKTQILRPL